ncbi:aminopeptidase [Polyangium sp. y55x31]|uniref:aminopeptidase n=1 Tax=Polyangium sp. y55x31 TaxID=3042688 RepID=UPI0024821923|nr:aminopeptidase [Polyangium sp. y55x31]MDI1481678.1 aminopeptidase [Polyangium sp. y55x31]
MHTNATRGGDLSDLAMRGVDIFLDGYARVDQRTGVVLAVHAACAEAGAWIGAALELNDIPLAAFGFAHRDDARFEEDLTRSLARLRAASSVERTTVIVCELSTVSFSRVLRRAIAADRERVSVHRLVNCTSDLFELGFQVSALDQRRINAEALHKLGGASRLRITSKGGTDLEITLDPLRYRWMSNHGTPGPGEILVLPAGEVNTFPATIRGRLVADGAFNYNFPTEIDARLAESPVVIEIEDGKMASYHCDDPRVLALLAEVFADVASRNVGELGFGTNVGITRFIPMNSHLNERHPGVHIGFGEHGQPGRVAFQALRHLDLVFDDARVLIDGHGVFDRGSLVPTDAPHPSDTHGEDTEGVHGKG